MHYAHAPMNSSTFIFKFQINLKLINLSQEFEITKKLCAFMFYIYMCVCIYVYMD